MTGPPPVLVLSPCGTSLLGNTARAVMPRAGRVLSRHANAVSSGEVPSRDRQVLEDLIQAAGERLHAARPDKACELSAELNGILSPDLGLSPRERNHHLLAATDTWLGRETARLVAAWLQRHWPGAAVEILHPRDMNTRDLDAFRFGLSDLVQELDSRLPGFRKSGYRIVFNLTGGFKGVLVFLQSVASIYADEVVYIFEGSHRLLRIPSLPLRLDTTLVRRRQVLLRRLLLDLPPEGLDEAGAAELDSLLLRVDGAYMFSPWGEAFTRRALDALGRRELLPEASPRLRYHGQFRKQARDLPPDRLATLNRRMDQLARCLESADRDGNPASLDFKPLKGRPMPPATHEIDAWHDQGAPRVFGYFASDGVFVVWKLGPHL